MKDDILLNDLKRRRDELQEKLVDSLHPPIVDKAVKNRVMHFILMYIAQRRRLGYLNRIPQELGKYADSLEGLVRAEKFMVGDTLDTPQEKIEDEYYQFIDHNGLGVHPENCHKSPDFYANLPNILHQKNINALVKKWTSFVYKNSSLSGAPGGDCISRFFRRHFNKIKWKMETAVLVRYLAKILKEDGTFYNFVKQPIKERCRSHLREIELRIGEGIMVTPDVETSEPCVRDFISTTALLRNVKRGENSVVDDILRQMENLGKRIRELEDDADGQVTVPA